MENTALYIVKACSLTALFYTAYYLLLRKETFFRANRWFLLAGLLTSVLLPLAVFTKVVWVEPAPLNNVNAISLQGYNIQAATAAASLEFEWWMAALGIYGLVTAFLFTRLAIDFKRVLRLFRGQAAIEFGRFKIIDTKAAKSPFSFFNYIVYNSDSLEPGELEGIISHEKVHSSQRHSIDMLLAQLFCTAFWFNPFAWLYKKAIAQNLEFIADAEAVKHVSDVTAYQKTLLKMTLELQNSSIASHFYQPLIKKRIIMINKPKSRKRNTAKYALVLPLLSAFMFFFQVKTEAREKATPSAATVTSPADSLTFKSIKFTITKDTEDKIIKESIALIASTYKINATYDVDRNSKKEITSVKVVLKGNGLDKVYKERNSNPIKDLSLEVSQDIDGNLTANFTNPIKAEPLYVMTKAKDPEDETPDQKNMRELENMLVVIDGVKQPKGYDWNTIDPLDIAEVNVYKNEAEILERFGIEGKNGVFEIITKKQAGALGNDVQAPAKPVVVNNISLIVEEKNGNETLKLRSWAAQGAVEITDTGNGKGKTTFRLVDDGNSGFIIKKESTNADLDFYIEVLARNNIKMKYWGVQRNEKGEITKISVELTKNGNKATGKFESSTGIISIYTGEKNGQLVTASMK